MSNRASRRIYIASPYRKGDMALNVKRQMDCAETLMDYGFFPYTPLLSHFQKIHSGRDDNDWLKLDLVWVEACGAVLRLNGESSGADNEVAHAKRLNIPVFYSFYDLINSNIFK